MRIYDVNKASPQGVNELLTPLCLLLQAGLHFVSRLFYALLHN